MEYTEKMLAIEKKIQANADKLQTSRTRVSALETEQRTLELSRKELMLNDYLPIIEALNMTPTELKELLGGHMESDKNTDSEVSVYDEE